MTLLELRQYAIRNQLSIRFTTAEAGECVIDPHGILKLPATQSAQNFTIDSSLASIEEFVLDPAGGKAKRQTVSRRQLQSSLGSTRNSASDHED
jgi:hypothetical protein